MKRAKGRVFRFMGEQLERRWMLTTSPFTIMPMGDSISAGLTQADADRLSDRFGFEVSPRDSYRPILWDTIQAEFAAPDVELVGTTNYNPTDLPSEAERHATYRGFWTLSFFPHPAPNIGSDPDGVINTNLSDADGWGGVSPDLAMILLGTNDLLGDRSDTNIRRDLQRIVEELRDDQPDVTILLGTIVPMDPERDAAARVPVTNDIIRDLVNPVVEEEWLGHTEQSPLIIVDHFAGVNGGPAFDAALHLVDGVHPNAAGDQLLADNWWHFLEPILATHHEPSVEFTTTAATVNEGVGTVDVTVTRTGGDLTQSLTVDYSVGGTATSGADFDALSGQVTFAADSSDATIQVQIIDDNEINEPNESIIIQLQDNSGYGVGTADTSTITLEENDILPVVSMTQLGSDLVESGQGKARFQVSRTGDLGEALTVHYDLSGTATAGQDYDAPASTSVVIPAGVSSVAVDIALRDDSLTESAETIVATLRDDVDYVVGTRVADIMVADDDDQSNPFETIFANFTFRNIFPFQMS